jgi:hypothetical protein
VAGHPPKVWPRLEVVLRHLDRIFEFFRKLALVWLPTPPGLLLLLGSI